MAASANRHSSRCRLHRRRWCVIAQVAAVARPAGTSQGERRWCKQQHSQPGGAARTAGSHTLGVTYTHSGAALVLHAARHVPTHRKASAALAGWPSSSRRVPTTANSAPADACRLRSAAACHRFKALRVRVAGRSAGGGGGDDGESGWGARPRGIRHTLLAVNRAGGLLQAAAGRLTSAQGRLEAFLTAGSRDQCGE